MALQFSDEQWDHFDERAEELFAQRLAAHQREEQAVWVQRWSDDVLQQRIRSGIARAQSHGFTWESSIAKFVTLMVRFAPDFDRFPPMREVLARTDVAAESRADLLFDSISAEQWAAAEERYDPASWREFG